jgi:3-dehydroquinate dehydratase/shikimate dehydrogenase
MSGPALLDRLVSPSSAPLTAVYGIVGGSQRHSLAPSIFTTGFRELGLAAVYLPFFPSDFRSFWSDVVLDELPRLGFPMRGLTVVSPHKEAALAVAATTGGRADKAHAANCLVLEPAGWHAANTSGLIDLLAVEDISPRGLRTAVVGCGGAGRSIAAELSAHGAIVTLVNRGDRRGRYASLLLGLAWTPLAQFSPNGFDLVINATPLARELPFDPSELQAGSVVADLAYIADRPTALIERVQARGLVAIDGRKVLAVETDAQFRLMTGQPLPPDAVRVALG